MAAETGVQATEQGHAFERAAGDAWAPLPCTYRRRDPEGTVLHQVVRENLSTFLAEAEAHRGLPRHVEQDFLQYLSCGVLAQGFSRVRCESCGDEVLVAFSCKRRGVCPSCNARRAHDTAIHLVERVLPHVPFRQWTLSFPKRIRWHLARDVGLCSDVLNLFLRALFAYHRRRGRELGFEGQSAAVSFVQRFGSALQLNVHFHVLVPEGLFAAPSPGTGARATFLPLSPPTDDEVEALLRTVIHRVVDLLTRRGCLDEEAYPNDALEALQAAALQRRFPFSPDERSPPRKRRCASLEGLSLHANTHFHERDRHGPRVALPLWRSGAALPRTT